MAANAPWKSVAWTTAPWATAGCRAAGVAANLLAGDHFSSADHWTERLLAAEPTGVFFDDDLRAADVLPRCEAVSPGFSERVHIVSHANVGNDDLPPRTVRLELDGFAVGRLIVNVIHGIAAGNLPCDTTYGLRPTLVNPPQLPGE